MAGVLPVPLSAATFQNPRPHVVNLTDVHMFDANIGFASGANGVLLKTTDGGVSWTTVNNPGLESNYSITDLHFPTSTFGVAVGQNGLVMTWDSATGVWTQQISGTGTSMDAVFFIDNTTGWAVGMLGEIIHTTNGGVSWTPQTSGVTSYTLTGVYFVDANTGWAVSDGGDIINTTDGGATWSLQSNDASWVSVQLPRSASVVSFPLFDITCVDALTCWVVGSDEIIGVSTDGGVTWTQQNGMALGSSLSRLKFTSATEGWAIGETLLLYTNDAGTTWSPEPLPSGVYNSLAAINGLELWIVGYDTLNGMHSVVATSNDGGLNWTDLGVFTNSAGLMDVQMVNGNNGYAVGVTGTALKTNDGGVNWMPLTTGIVSETLNAVDFPLDEFTGWAVGDMGAILQTTDMGGTWNPQTSGTGETLFGVDMLNNTTGWAVGGMGTILYTTDGGSTWTPQTSGTSMPLNDVQALDANNVYVVGDTGTALQTTDGGTTWTPVTLPLSYKGGAVHFADSNTGYLAMAMGAILKTTDGGANWTALSTGIGYDINDIACVSADVCAAVGATSQILKTTDGGTTWAAATALDYGALTAVSVVPGGLNPFWTVHSGNGWILKDELGYVDGTPPGDVTNLTAAPFSTDTTTLTASFDPATDPESGIAEYSYSIGTTPGGIDVVDWTTNGQSTAITATGLSLTQGQTYFINVRAKNGVGMESNVVNASTVIDTTPPDVLVEVFDGVSTGVDEDTTTSTTQLDFNWAASADAESGVTGYWVSVGTTPGGSDVRPALLITNPFYTQVEPLTVGVTYYATVQVQNGANQLSTAVTSDGITVVTAADTAPPAAGSINYADGLNTSGSITLDLVAGYDNEGPLSASGTVTQATATFDGATCGTFTTFASIMQVDIPSTPVRKAGKRSAAIATPPLQVEITPLEAGTCYMFQWEVGDISGNVATYTSSSVVQLAPLPPPPPPLSISALYDGLSGDDVDYTTSLDTLTAHWTAPPTEAGTVTAYTVGVGTAAGLNDILSTSAAATDTQVTLSGFSLVQGSTYFINVLANDSQGPGPVTSTDGITVDSTPPSPVGAVTGYAYFSPSQSMGGQWVASSDTESGVTGYSISVGTTPGGSDVLAGVVVTGNTYTNTSLTLAIGTTYYLTVQSVNGAGLLGEAVTSAGFPPVEQPAADTTPPTAVSGLSGVAYTVPSHGVDASWTAADDPESGVTGYSISVGTTPGGDDVIASAQTTSTTFSTPDVTLTLGVTYYVTVQAINGEGQLGEAVTSAGILPTNGSTSADNTPPTAVSNLTGFAYTNPSHSIGADWDVADDPESGVTGYSVSVGTTPGGSDVLAGVFTTLNGFSSAEVSLMLDVPYYVTAQAINGEGQPGEAVTSAAILPLNGTPSPLSLGSTAVDVGLVTPGTFSVMANVMLNAGVDLSNVRIFAGDLTSSGGGTIAASMVLSDPATLPTLAAGGVDTLLVKVMVQSGTSPGLYEGTQYVYADLDGDGRRARGEPLVSFRLSLSVPDFAALGATCPIETASTTGGAP